MSGRMKHALRHLRFAAALVAMLGGMWAAVDLHTHPTGLHAPTVCHVCDLERAVSGGMAPAPDWTAEPALVSAMVMLPEPQLHTVAGPGCARIRAPPLA